MKLIYMGTPDFAVAPLKAIMASRLSAGEDFCCAERGKVAGAWR